MILLCCEELRAHGVPNTLGLRVAYTALSKMDASSGAERAWA